MSGIELAMLALAAGGTAMTIDQQMSAADRQDEEINRAIMEQAQSQKKINEVVNQNVDQYDPLKRQERLTQETDAATKSLTDALDTAYAAIPKNEYKGNLSREFLTSDAARKIDTANRAMDIARLMGKIRGPTSMMTGEGNMNADYANEAAILANAAGGNSRVSNIRINNAGRVDPLITGLGGLAQTAGTMGLMAGMSPGSPGVTPLGKLMGVGSKVTLV